MKLVIAQEDVETKAGYRPQKGYSYKLNNSPTKTCAKGSPLATAIRLVIRLVELSEKVDSYATGEW